MGKINARLLVVWFLWWYNDSILAKCCLARYGGAK